MATRAISINPSILTWARQRAGLTIEELGLLIGKTESVIQDWEEGSDAPTFRQLEAIAAKLKRPVALFFFSRPPEEVDPDTEFRTLPAARGVDAARDTRFAIRDAYAKQLRILELSRGQNPAGSEFLFERVPAEATAADIRAELGVDLQGQISWSSPEEAFKGWRFAFESVGIFVFKRSFKQMEVSGFCLPHQIAPLLVVNNGTSWTRQIFTLFHELAHLLHRSHGVTRGDSGYLDSLTPSDREVDVASNKFAASVLIPSDDFAVRSSSFDGGDEALRALARRYNVSREVVLRKLVDDGRIDASIYEQRVNEWNQEFLARRERSGPDGGNYYATQASYLGRAYLDLAFSSYHAGSTSLAELADHLSIKARNVGKLEEFVLRSGA